MFRLLRHPLALWCFALVLSTAAPVRAETPGEADKVAEKAAEGAGTNQGDALPAKGKYKVTFKVHDFEEERAFDLEKEGDRKTLRELLETGAIVEMSREPNLMKPETDLGLWTLVVFLVLLALLYKLAWGPMLQGLKKREESISGALEAAQKANEDAKKLQADLQTQMAEANQRVNALMEETRKAAARTQEEMLAKARADIAAERDRLRRDLDMARDQALQDLAGYAARLATDVAARVLRRDLNVDDQRRLVDDALAEMHQAAADRNRVPTGA